MNCVAMIQMMCEKETFVASAMLNQRLECRPRPIPMLPMPYKNAVASRDVPKEKCPPMNNSHE